ncbi:MAG: tocopherol cyclase family protein [Anaerolineae bacterium]|jgi:hypothetical protein
MFNFFRNILHPARYHGHDKRPPFFEGWYYKLVSEGGRQRYAIIPGIFLSDDPDRQHAFVQVLDGVTGRSAYHRYPADAFWAARDAFHLRIGDSDFTADRIRLNVEGEELGVQGELRFEGITPWPVRLTSPGIMGWYAWVPFMETYHGVVSLDHGIEGGLTVEGATVDFSGGRGYIEKDWGRAFPAAWIWLQANHFDAPGTSLTASVAIIPWLRGSFPGFILGLWHEGQLYRFATYTGARIASLDIGDRVVEWRVVDDHYRLHMTATRPQGGLLQAPTTVGMDRRIAETMDARVDVRLEELGGGAEVFSGTGRYACLEAVGDLDRLRGLWVGDEG